MILELFPKDKSKVEEPEANFFVSYRANCFIHLKDLDGATLSELEWQNLVSYAVERTLMYLKLNYADFNCYNEIYFHIEDENNSCCKIDESRDSISVFFELIYDHLVEMSSEDKHEFYFGGDCWMAENKMENVTEFIADAYRPTIGDDQILKSVFSKFDSVPVFNVENFEFLSYIEAENYYEAFFGKKDPSDLRTFSFNVADNVSFYCNENEDGENISIVIEVTFTDGFRYEIEMDEWLKYLKDNWEFEDSKTDIINTWEYLLFYFDQLNDFFEFDNDLDKANVIYKKIPTKYLF